MQLGTIPTSGYLAGNPRGGQYVQRLEDTWAELFHVRHAIAVNSGTAGLFACCKAVGNYPSIRLRTAVSPLGMSATAAAPRLAGHNVYFVDVDDWYCMDPRVFMDPTWIYPEVIIPTNLFGHPAQLRRLRDWCDRHSVTMIEDNAQALFATEDGRYAGTIGHIGVFSFNVHKHLNVGEGGMVVTDDNGLAERLRLFINHGEARNHGPGLNLRMTELTAAFALSQINNATRAAEEARELAGKLLETLDPFKALIGLPRLRAGACSSWYVFALQFPGQADQVQKMIGALCAEGVPVSRYAPLMTTLTTFQGCDARIDQARRLSAGLGILELLAMAPTDAQIKQIGVAFEKVITWTFKESESEKDAGLSL
jgi:dTDP-4-amino-4,6-dideoxygalactose transaminase